MSTFVVNIKQIEEIKPHPNADRLELAKVIGLGYQFCIRKDAYKVGDPVVYFPVDSLLPAELADKMGIRNFLSGKSHDRVKTVKLRGQISQGLVASPETALPEWNPFQPEYPSDYDYAPDLNVKKYESPEISCKAGRLVPLPDGVSIYDIEGADNYPEVIKYLLDKPVFITEKLEGTNASYTCNQNHKVFVNQRRYSIKPVESAEHDFYKVATDMNLFNKVQAIRTNLAETTGNPDVQVTIRGELIGAGIQKNIYKHSKRTVRFFDILVDGKYLDVNEFIDVCHAFTLPVVPILAFDVTLREWLNGKSLQEASNEKSDLFNGINREGIVIKPMIEERHEEIGRLIIKQRSPEYLAGSEL